MFFEDIDIQIRNKIKTKLIDGRKCVESAACTEPLLQKYSWEEYFKRFNDHLEQDISRIYKRFINDDKGRCFYCNQELDLICMDWQLDHVTPITDFKNRKITDYPDTFFNERNYDIICLSCNTDKFGYCRSRHILKSVFRSSFEIHTIRQRNAVAEMCSSFCRQYLTDDGATIFEGITFDEITALSFTPSMLEPYIKDKNGLQALLTSNTMQRQITQKQKFLSNTSVIQLSLFPEEDLVTSNDQSIRPESIISQQSCNNQEFDFPILNSVNNPRSIHGIFPYRGKISSLDAHQFLTQLPQGSILVDPFCGSGTILYEANRLNISTIGTDLNPIALTLSMAKMTKSSEVSPIRLESILEEAKNITTISTMPERVSKYFTQMTANQIMALYSIKDSLSAFELASLYGAVALTARGCNNYMWTSSQIGKIAEEQRDIDFFSKFETKYRQNTKYLLTNPHGDIYRCDARELTSTIAENSVDFVYTSPPYFNALDYTANYSRLLFDLDPTLQREEVRSKLSQHSKTYEEDMKMCLHQIYSILKPGGQAIIVVGDKKQGKKIINGGEFFSNLTDWKPQYVKERGYTGTASQVWDKVNSTKRKEQIVVWRK